MLLFLVAKISFHAVSRVLDIFSKQLGFKAPCTQTVINWTTKLCIARMQYAYENVSTKLLVNKFSNGFIWILDTSIGLSSGKILAVLALDANHFKNHSRAPTLKDVHCVGVSVSPSWTGIAIADFLKKIVDILGYPVALLKDGGKDLAKAVDDMKEFGFHLNSIADVSHVIANFLKHEYENHPQYPLFMSACGTASKMLKQTILACFAPPTVSTKARFMNIHKLILWAQRVLAHSPPGRVKQDSILDRLRKAMGNLRTPSIWTSVDQFFRSLN